MITIGNGRSPADEDVATKASAIRSLASLITASTSRVASGFAPRVAATRRHSSRAHGAIMGKKGRPGNGMGVGSGQTSADQTPVPPDGTPLFFVYVRPGDGMPWLPLTAFRGEGPGKAVVQGWLNAPIFKDQIYNRIDGLIASNIYENELRLRNMAAMSFGRLVKDKSQVQFGYRFDSTDVQKKVAKGDIKKPGVKLINRGMVGAGPVKDLQNFVKDKTGVGSLDDLKEKVGLR